MIDPRVNSIRGDFPALSMEVYGQPLIFLDSAASSLKPLSVIEGISDYYKSFNSNVHRGSYKLSQLASDAYDGVRHQLHQYLGTASINEIVFTKGTTEAINLIAFGLSDTVRPGDQILLTQMEHHANIIPWQRLAEQKQAEIQVVPLDQDGSLNLSALRTLLNERTRILAITHVSNVLGTINPIREIAELAHRFGAVVVVDGAQGIVHGPVDVQQLDCDFYCFSGHKFYGPMGIGVLYGKEHWLEKMPPYQLGGAMIERVSFEKTSFKGLPHKFEAGTPNVEGVIGLGKAIDYVENLGWDYIQQSEQALLKLAERELSALDGVGIIGRASNKGPICSIVADGAHAYDIGTLLDKFGIACRTGNHCTQPLHDALGISGTLRASFAFYNTTEEIHIFVRALQKSLDMLR